MSKRAEDDDQTIGELPDFCGSCGEEAVIGFGLAGGGFGPYAYCPGCQQVIGKVQIDD